MSGLTVLHGDDCENLTVTTTLRMRTLSDEEIRAYIATGERWTRRAPTPFRALRPCSSSVWTAITIT